MFNVFRILQSHHLKHTGQNMLSKYIPFYLKWHYYVLESKPLITVNTFRKDDRNLLYFTNLCLAVLLQEILMYYKMHFYSLKC